MIINFDYLVYYPQTKWTHKGIHILTSCETWYPQYSANPKYSSSATQSVVTEVAKVDGKIWLICGCIL